MFQKDDETVFSGESTGESSGDSLVADLNNTELVAVVNHTCNLSTQQAVDALGISSNTSIANFTGLLEIDEKLYYFGEPGYGIFAIRHADGNYYLCDEFTTMVRMMITTSTTTTTATTTITTVRLCDVYVGGAKLQGQVTCDD